eukprot:scaffold240428_cov36-Tisochrysis_lutea.AAC.1
MPVARIVYVEQKHASWAQGVMASLEQLLVAGCAEKCVRREQHDVVRVMCFKRMHQHVALHDARSLVCSQTRASALDKLSA